MFHYSIISLCFIPLQLWMRPFFWSLGMSPAHNLRPRSISLLLKLWDWSTSSFYRYGWAGVKDTEWTSSIKKLSHYLIYHIITFIKSHSSNLSNYVHSLSQIRIKLNWSKTTRPLNNIYRSKNSLRELQPRMPQLSRSDNNTYVWSKS